MGVTLIQKAPLASAVIVFWPSRSPRENSNGSYVR